MNVGSEKGASVREVVQQLGFSSPRYFAHVFRREIGVPPSLYAQIRAEARTYAVLDW